VDKLRQRRRNARVEGKNEGRRRARGDGGEGRGWRTGVGALFFPLLLFAVLR